MRIKYEIALYSVNITFKSKSQWILLDRNIVHILTIQNQLRIIILFILHILFFYVNIFYSQLSFPLEIRIECFNLQILLQIVFYKFVSNMFN